MKVGDGKEKHFLVEVKNDGAGELEKHHLPGHQDYVEEGKITQQHQHLINKKGKYIEISEPENLVDGTIKRVSDKPDVKKIEELIKRLREKDKKSSGTTYLPQPPSHQDYVQEDKITQQRHSIDKKSKKTELGGGPTRPQLDSRPKKKTDVKCGSTSSDCEYVEIEDLPGLNVRKPDKKEIKEIIKRILEDKRKKDLKDYGS